MEKKKVLIVIGAYLPGYRSGGPQRTIENVCEYYAEQCDIFIITKNHDYADNTPYEIPIDKWISKYGVNIMYLKDRDFSYSLFKNYYTQFDIIYTCGLFAKSTYRFMLINRFFHKDIDFYVAPMGVFSEGALSSKPLKKNLFLRAFSVLGVFHNIIWSFTSMKEKKEAEKVIGEKNINNYIIAEDLPKKYEWEENSQRVQASERGKLKIVFLSRIVEKKNTLKCIEILDHEFGGEIVFDIYGNIEDQSYWNSCKEALKKLPQNISVRYCGEIIPDEVVETFLKYDCFLFPTKGENFGHVVYEALSAGCIPIISDKTPWTELGDQKCGNVVELNNTDGFRAAIDTLLFAKADDIVKQKKSAILFAEKKYREINVNSGYSRVFLNENKK